MRSFDSALDEFYSKQEEQKEQIRLLKEKAAALNTVERERQRHQAQIDSLANAQNEVISKAELIMTNLPAVEKVHYVPHTWRHVTCSAAPLLSVIMPFFLCTFCLHLECRLLKV